ncbi:hypothetical protein SHIRM173S_07729 [Streptomyces hirsutus]
MTGTKAEPSVTGTKTERAAAGARSGAVPAGVRRLVNRLLAILVALVVWHLFALGPGASGDFPRPLESFRTAIDLAGTGAYWSNIATSVETALLGLALAVLVGLPAGLLIGANEHARRSTQLLLDFGRTVPAIALLPLFLLLFGATRDLGPGPDPGFGAAYPWQLSGGMQQRVAIARALAYRPAVVVMDEPFASVDAQTRADLEDLLLRVREHLGITVLLVTHDIDEAVYLSDRVLALGGKPAESGNCSPSTSGPREQVTTKALPRFAELRSQVYRLIRHV